MKQTLRMKCHELHFACDCVAENYDIMLYNLGQLMIENEDLKKKIIELENNKEMSNYANHLNLV
jgi:hypothetical protein